MKPTDPKTYFAKFLLNYAHEKKIEALVSHWYTFFQSSYKNLLSYLNLQREQAAETALAECQ